mmetsp:Transcript_6923/g.10960  ORF Transcript_6923/g.10960 Transcript_6923/m.10960 type:complete len:108 (-) Transcript_6923:194-517(-)
MNQSFTTLCNCSDWGRPVQDRRTPRKATLVPFGQPRSKNMLPDLCESICNEAHFRAEYAVRMDFVHTSSTSVFTSSDIALGIMLCGIALVESIKIYISLLKYLLESP